jgi:hypothetical protein
MKQDHSVAQSRPQRTLLRALCTNLAVGASLLLGGTAAFGSTLAIAGKPVGSVTVGSQYVFTPSVTGAAAGHTPKFAITRKPAWAGFNANTGELFGYPQSDGTATGIVISVSDGIGSATLPAFAVTVTGTNPVKISGTPSASAKAGAAYSFRPTASDSTGRTLSYSVTNKPAWATFSIATGQLSGTPASTQAGTYSGIVISASDGKARAYLPMFAITVSSSSVTTNTSTATLAQKHPGDVGMATDPAVVHYEDFSAASVTAVLTRYSSYKHTAGMELVADHPANSPSPHALRLTSGGANPETNIYRSFGAGYDELYYRYYIKYEGSGPWHHSGLWFGGYNPALPYPYPHAGQRPDGADRFSVALEPIGNPENAMDFYVYWRGMHSYEANPTGLAWYGNTMIHEEVPVQSNTWICYEIHMKLNPDAANATGAVLEVWKDDTLVRRFDDTGPFGFYVGDWFCPNDSDGTECTKNRPAKPNLILLDQRWRTTTALKINYFWPEHYNTSSTNSSLRLDDMVVAKQRIGCTVPK